MVAQPALLLIWAVAAFVALRIAVAAIKHKAWRRAVSVIVKTGRMPSRWRVVGATALAFLLVSCVVAELLYKRLAHPIDLLPESKSA